MYYKKKISTGTDVVIIITRAWNGISLYRSKWSQEREEEWGSISKAFEGIDQALLLVMKSWMDIER